MEKEAFLTDIRTLTPDQLGEVMSALGEKPFRARQIYEWLWSKAATDFDQMSNLSLPLREQLKAQFTIRPIRLDHQQISGDRTIKSGFRLYDGSLVEGVLIPTETRMTACISSQVGCSLACEFCATGKLQRVRNLDAAEIYDQVVMIDRQARQHYDLPLTNIVMMGMGEPLLNYNQVSRGIERITAADGLNMSPKRITLSTAGIAKMIRKMADDQVKVNLALSLHAADDEKRNKIMAINETNSLEALREALVYFHRQTHNPITLEYIAFHNFNLSRQDANNLVRFANGFPCKINLIEYNAIGDGKFQRAEAMELNPFISLLEKKGLVVNVRRSRGKDIDAACGQLANKNTVE